MKASERVFVNTVAQYIKTIISLCISLYSTRLVLASLGVVDYGIYTLIAGVVSLLSFITNALVISTQRFLSYNSGCNDCNVLKQVFSSSLVIHILLGLACFIILESISSILFNHVLDIPTNRIDSAIKIYHFVVLMVMFTFITSPFRALLIAHENIIYISIIDIIDAFMKLLIALSLSYTTSDKLVVYGFLLCVIQVFNFLVFSCYGFKHYEECIFPRFRFISKKYIKELFSFATWTTINVICISGRTQGVSIIINKFFSLAVNTAYGLGLQVTSALGFLSQSIRNALNPQIMKAEGEGNRERMLYLSELESKLCLLLMSMILIPCLFEMEGLLNIWLGSVPEYATLFCRVWIIATIIDQFTIGLDAANQAYGSLKLYTLVINFVKLLTIPMIILLLKIEVNLEFIVYCLIVFESICCVLRLLVLKVQIKLSIRRYVLSIIRIVPCIILSVLFSYIIAQIVEFRFRFILTIFVSILICSVTAYFIVFNKEERAKLSSLISRYINILKY